MTSQHGAYALHAGKSGYIYVRSCTRPRARIPTRTHTHRPISNTYCCPIATIIYERASVLRYTYIVPLVVSAW
jgi:hypothetical protein